MSGLGASFDRAQWAYDHQMPPEAPECGCEMADDPEHDAQQCLDDQREAAAEDRAERMREDRMFEREDREIVVDDRDIPEDHTGDESSRDEE